MINLLKSLPEVDSGTARLPGSGARILEQGHRPNISGVCCGLVKANESHNGLPEWAFLSTGDGIATADWKSFDRKSQACVGRPKQDRMKQTEDYAG
jgi:hypothetical protein